MITQIARIRLIVSTLNSVTIPTVKVPVIQINPPVPVPVPVPVVENQRDTFRL